MNQTAHITSLCKINTPLDARCACAAASFMVDQEAANNVRLDAYTFAHQVGMSAVGSGEPMPVHFEGEPDLEQGWHQGLSFQCDLDEMNACRYCQDRDVLLCPTHG
ncbi:hypothetical protein DBR42_22955 [Pelomonas sp. HMWF004]|nr:hypothetical protein DBR42_22955 [Pelomonas sp. HMWF004]